MRSKYWEDAWVSPWNTTEQDLYDFIARPNSEGKRLSEGFRMMDNDFD